MWSPMKNNVIAIQGDYYEKKKETADKHLW